MHDPSADCMNREGGRGWGASRGAELEGSPRRRIDRDMDPNDDGRCNTGISPRLWVERTAVIDCE